MSLFGKGNDKLTTNQKIAMEPNSFKDLVCF
jgi:hypothetical protein